MTWLSIYRKSSDSSLGELERLSGEGGVASEIQRPVWTRRKGILGTQNNTREDFQGEVSGASRKYLVHLEDTVHGMDV